jgi:hypothetical protein
MLESEAITAQISRGQTGAHLGSGTGSIRGSYSASVGERGDLWSSGDAAEGGLYRYTDRGTDFASSYIPRGGSIASGQGQGYGSRSVDLNQSVMDGSVPPKLLQKFKRIIQEKEAFRQVEGVTSLHSRH